MDWAKPNRTKVRKYKPTIIIGKDFEFQPVNTLHGLKSTNLFEGVIEIKYTIGIATKISVGPVAAKTKRKPINELKIFAIKTNKTDL